MKIYYYTSMIRSVYISDQRVMVKSWKDMIGTKESYLYRYQSFGNGKYGDRYSSKSYYSRSLSSRIKDKKEFLEIKKHYGIV